MPDDIRGWLTDALSRRTRHPELEQTLFHRLQELEHGPLEQLTELVRAIVEELRVSQGRLAEQARDMQSLKQTVAALTVRVDELAAGVPPEPPIAEGHVLLLPSPDGYALVERPGLPPEPGERLEHEGRAFRVLNRAPSPLPSDDRSCLLALPD